MMIVPSIARIRSLRVLLTSPMTFCILSISWRRKMLRGFRCPMILSLKSTFE